MPRPEILAQTSADQDRLVAVPDASGDPGIPLGVGVNIQAAPEHVGIRARFAAAGVRAGELAMSAAAAVTSAVREHAPRVVNTIRTEGPRAMALLEELGVLDWAENSKAAAKPGKTGATTRFGLDVARAAAAHHREISRHAG